MPTNSAPPNYYSDPHISYQKNFARYTPEARMDSFRFPETSYLNSFRLSRHPSDTPFRRRNATEGETSPGYESDAESDVMPSHPITTDHPASRLMLPSPDYMWDLELEPALSLRRRHSDSFIHERPWKFPAYVTPWSHEEARYYPPASSLHPFVSTRDPMCADASYSSDISSRCCTSQHPSTWLMNTMNTTTRSASMATHVGLIVFNRCKHVRV